MKSMTAIENVVDLYIRVSTTEQAKEGYSVSVQEERLRNYCSAMNYVIHAVHVDPGYSGATLERPGIKEIISDVEHGKCKKVIVWKLDRLSRSQKDTLILLDDIFLTNDCNFVSLLESFDTSTPFGRCIVGILAAFAQMERENIKMRTMMGKQARIRCGHFHGSHAPIGYKFQVASNGTVISNDIMVDPYVAKLIKEVYQLFISGWSISSIAKHMYESHGSSLYDWGHNTAIRRILSNPVYMGKVRSGPELYDGIHDPLVFETEWYTAAAILEHNKELDKRTYTYKVDGVKTDNILTGLLFCGDCGARMYARKISKNKKKYICHSVAKTSSAMIKSANCTNRLHLFTVPEMDNMILTEIKKLALDRSYFEAMASDVAETDPEETKIYEERLTEVKRQIDRLLNLYQTGLVEMDEVKSRLGDLNREKTQLESNIANADPGPQAAKIKDTAWKAVTSLQAVLDEGNMEEVHRIVHIVIDKVVILNNDITIFWSFS